MNITKVPDNIEKTQLNNLPVLFLSSHPLINYTEQVKEMLYTNPDETNPLKDLFFSPENIEIIQRQIILTIYNTTNKRFKITKYQQAEPLNAVMTYIFEGYGRNLPNNITQQIRDLNNQVVKELIPYMITELKQYVGYLYDSTTPLRPIDRPENVSIKGNRSLSGPINRLAPLK